MRSSLSPQMARPAGGLESVRGLVWGGDQMDLIRFAREDRVFEDQGFGECLALKCSEYCTQEGCSFIFQLSIWLSSGGASV